MNRLLAWILDVSPLSSHPLLLTLVIVPRAFGVSLPDGSLLKAVCDCGTSSESKSVLVVAN